MRYKDMPEGETPDFHVEKDSAKGVVYYTPLSHAAEDWCRKHLANVVRVGRSYVFAKSNERADRLRGFLKKEGFAVSR